MRSRLGVLSLVEQSLHNESVLRLSLRALGVEQMPGFADTAADMDEFVNRKKR